MVIVAVVLGYKIIHSNVDIRIASGGDIRLVLGLGEEQGVVCAILGVSERIGGDGLEQVSANMIVFFIMSHVLFCSANPLKTNRHYLSQLK